MNALMLARMTQFWGRLFLINFAVQYPHVGPECQSRARVMVEK
jgi:hypothetical protein